MFRSLRTRLAISFLAIVIVTLVTAGVAFFARLDGYQEDLTATTLRQVAGPIYYNIALFRPADAERPVLAGQKLKNELDAYLQLQAQQGMIVFPVDSRGHVIASDVDSIPQDARDETFVVPPPPAAGPNFKQLPLYHYTTSEGGKLVYVSVPMTRVVRAQGEGINAVVIALPDTGRRDVFRDLFPRLLFAGMIGAAAAVLAVLLLAAWIYRPLGKVTRGIRAVAAGDYSGRVPVGGPSEVRELARDVNTMADSVQSSQQTLREFLANVSHELKTPLTSIRGFSQALQDGTLTSPEERERAARVIDAESRRVLHLVGELLDLSRIESGQQQMQLTGFDLDELLSHVRDVFAIRARDAGITLDVLSSHGVPVVADFDRMEQVLGNLLDNAFRHTPAGGRVEVSAAARGPSVEIRVEDDGPGIPAEDLPHVFDRFYRSALGQSATNGSGLGLAITREIVRAHGGAIRAEQRPGGGARFVIALPQRASSREQAPGEHARAEAPQTPQPQT